MAAYAYTVTLDQPTVHKIGKLGVLRGQVDITNYNSVLAAISEITSRFKGAPTVLLGGLSTNGFAVSWIPASNSIKAWNPRAAHTHTENTNATYVQNATTASTAGAAAEQAATDVNVGSVSFVAFGVAP